MKNTTLYISVLTIAILSFSCIKFADEFELTETDPQIVINGILEPDSLFKVHVSRSISILDRNEANVPIEGAIVEVYEDGNLIDRLDQYNNGFYRSLDLKPEIQKEYTIIVEADDFETVWAKVRIPSDDLVYAIDTITKIEKYDNGYHEKFLEFNIDVKNNLDVKDFYMIEIYTRYWSYIYDYNEWDSKLVDSGYFYRDEHFYTQSPYAILGFSDFGSWVDEFNSTDDYYEGKYYGQKIIFSDEFMSESIEKIKVWYRNELYDYEDKYGPTTPVKIYIYRVSEDFIYYLKSHSTYYADPFDGFFEEKKITYCNVENGMGIMAAMSSQNFVFEIPVLTPPEYEEVEDDVNVK